MARVNLSLPDDLKARMDGLNQNWSEVAKAAFEHVVELEELRASGNEHEAGLQRLREEKRKNGARQEAEGERQGRSWALETATFDQLEQAAMLYQREMAADTYPSQEAIDMVNQLLGQDAFNLPGLRHVEAGGAYAIAFLAAAADVHSQV